ncbi:LemA family protein [Acinetobacter chinensis]|jgi:LemA protein|uniref:LemA family protein n=1 Tax=Acinetobacter chinensis TaxID=2004650 RepID=A0A3B7LVK1_9GAMM|nr:MULTISPECIES: LemA family protein [Acinetobacter]AXY55777.1 LemA family protein [Acinetobacter chinensis]AXY61119.1 LemA family protein [Acinetobacter sp. WCHAc010052]MDV2469802.1 LemA family protein [Acinetobacter chinensis]WOE42114.1 LemA family protein [Acinetobacter chinensis]
MGLLIFLLVIIAIVVGCVLVRNNIVRHHNATVRAWSDVASYERQKVKILDALQPLVEQYSAFEKGTLEKVTELRQNIMSLNMKTADVSQLQRIEALNRELIQNLNIVVENYPELKANEIYLRMMNEIDEQNENVGAAITIFNRNVELFNNHIQIFPNNIINTMTLGKKAIRPFRDSTTLQNFDYRPNF